MFINDNKVVLDVLCEYYADRREAWKLPFKRAYDYFKYLYDQGLLKTVYDKELIGYAEIWLINEEQYERISSDKPFYVLDENVRDGNICYVRELWVRHGRNCIWQLKKQMPPCDEVAWYREKTNRRHSWEVAAVQC